MEAPQKHQDKLDRQERRGQMKAAEARDQKLREKYGTTTVQMWESEDMENEVEVEKPECPECGGGIAVTRQPNSYPPIKAECMNCGETF